MKAARRFGTRLRAMARKEILHIVRDVRVIYLALGMPVVLLVLFGYAVSFDLDRLPMGVVDQDATPASRQVVAAMTSSGAFEASQTIESPDAVEPLFRKGKLKVALVIPKNYARDLVRGQDAEVQLLLDGADGTTTSIALGYAMGIGQAEARRLVEKSGLAPQLALQDRVRFRFNPAMRSAQFIVPGLIALILSILAVLLTALTVAREWERGNMEQLFATPVGRIEVVLGKLLPYIVLGLVQVLLVVTLGSVLFDVPVRGSLLVLFAAALVFLTGMLAQGLFISVVTRNQQVATQVGVVTAMLPTLLLSGFLFPIQNMPTALQVLSVVVPSRYFIRILRGVLLKGNGLDVLWHDLVAMIVFAVVMTALSSVRFRRRLD